MEHADRFLRRFYIEKGMFGSLSVTFIFYRPPLLNRIKVKDDLQLRLFHEWEPLSLKRLILQFTQYSPSKGKAHVVAAAIRKTVNETIGEFEKSKSIVK